MKRKRFVYFEIARDGMDVWRIGDLADMAEIVGWMHPSFAAEDRELLSWMEACDVGTMMSHRLGFLVRMADVDEEDVK